ncbi:hypothetical protein Desde_1080 [Desulfitobacterium dehalogenans ATCC 51507]|uniref:Uncharacterized protein n=1 Tax=Desulfitobacterium dehalogenans (strain ATCC 51507 / DSM 9161 / JW/IU-DC1) TaxID=756499 RepID=I4A6C8_DESDJ|nr:hypothetical protein [Desulfitobacterium dehalogenans]AFL99512.1 hypothetical protein Desde_1080 [Desulfitobacterium dehalogenans ATCC 51507]
MLSDELAGMMKDFLDRKVAPEEFSFEFPARLAYVTPELEKENKPLSDLLNEEMPETCANFEPNEAERKAMPGYYLSEEEVREKVKEVYDQAIRLL